MKKLLVFILFFFLVGCSNSTDLSIPEKIDPNGVTIESSSITTLNIDDYMFRDDVMYVDLRPYSWIAKDGHIAGFQFFPFYDFIAQLKQYDRLFKMEGSVGTVGCYVPMYEESIQLLYEFFPKDKYIFAISQSGLESIYFFNLLIQYEYDSSKLYNIGGFSNQTGFNNIPYKNIENPKYLVEGNAILEYSNDTFNFMKYLTPINREQ